jgi:HEAT repeat protein
MSPSLHNSLLPVVLALALSQASAAAPPSPEPADIERLVKQLGSERFEEREAADKALEKTGEPALEALRGAVRSPDAEIRHRAARSVETVVAQALSSPTATTPMASATGGMHADIWVNRPGGKRIGNWPGQR